MLLLRERCGSANFCFLNSSFTRQHKKKHYKKVMEEIQKEKELAGQEERMEKKEPRKLFMRWKI